jgi:hypothetical protein
MTRGHLPKSAFLYFSSWEEREEGERVSLRIWAGKMMAWGGKERRKTHHLRQTAGRDNVPGVDEAVQVPGRFFYRLAHLVVAVEIEDVGHEVQRILVVLDLGIETRQVEAVR